MMRTNAQDNTSRASHPFTRAHQRIADLQAMHLAPDAVSPCNPRVSAVCGFSFCVAIIERIGAEC
jgi:hypothetical protein